MDKATQWPYVIGVTITFRSSHQSQVLKLSTWRYVFLALAVLSAPTPHLKRPGQNEEG
jgi:hypothetical protein